MDSGKFDVARADRAVQLGFVMCQKICKEIRKADYVFVDMSEPNPNVYYELGLSFGFGKKIVFIFGDPMFKSEPSITSWNMFIGKRNKKFIHYGQLQWLAGETPEIDAFTKLIEKNKYDCSEIISPLIDPKSYIEIEQSGSNDNKQLLFCMSQKDVDFVKMRLLIQKLVEVLV